VNHLRFSVEQGEGGAPVSITRLADRARVDHVTSSRLQLQRDRFVLSDRPVFGTKAVRTIAVGEKSALQVSVPEER